MYNLNELAFEAMLENAKQAYNGNHFMKLVLNYNTFSGVTRKS